MRIRALAKAIVDRLVVANPDLLVGKMAKSARDGRIFLDYLRNAEGASAVAPYSTRNLSGPSCSAPLAWAELTDDLDIRAITTARVLERIAAGVDPWADMESAAAGKRTLTAAEKTLTSSGS
ncbi:MAG: hypothetical protein HGB10_05260 [Coriobacteriia bacterium]|nr:hypothetical protein [Coriobacteriia bacterium]